MPSPKRVLFLSTDNACRSQMAEGLLRSLGGGRFDVHSAGSRPVGHVHPLAVEVMKEIGIRIADAQPKPIGVLDGQSFDFVVTVCDGAREACPTFSSMTRLMHWSFEDPSMATGTNDQQLRVFRRIRDEIRHRVRRFIEAHAGP